MSSLPKMACICDRPRHNPPWVATIQVNESYSLARGGLKPKPKMKRVKRWKSRGFSLGSAFSWGSSVTKNVSPPLSRNPPSRLAFESIVTLLSPAHSEKPRTTLPSPPGNDTELASYNDVDQERCQPSVSSLELSSPSDSNLPTASHSYERSVDHPARHGRYSGSRNQRSKRHLLCDAET